MSYPSPLAQPLYVTPALIPPAPVHPALPVPAKKGRVAPIWLMAILVVFLIGVIAYFLRFLGPGASMIGLVLALIPLVGVVIAVHLVDRWEPEPLSLRIFALAWGATAAVGLTLLVDWGLQAMAGRFITPSFQMVIQAPVVEEISKGIGIFLIFAFARRTFDGPVDGVVYGALVGAGFAFTENIQYFAVSMIQGGVPDTAGTFFVRGILSPFAHVMFCCVTGYVLGRAARVGRTTAQAVGPFAGGLVGAMILHGIWNGSALYADFYFLYLVLQVPLFLLFVGGIIALRREEARMTRAMLTDYAHAGWFSGDEVSALATGAGRRRAIQWSRTLPGDRTPIMRSFIREATLLAAARARVITGRDPGAGEDERVYLARAVAARGALFAP